MRERTLVLLKPDAVRRGLMGRIISRFEDKGLDIIAMKMLRFDKARTLDHYGQYAEEDFFPALSEFIQSGPSVAMVLEGPDAIALVRKMMGATRPMDAEPGTIRGDFANIVTANLVHGSDSPETARVEVRRFFDESEMFSPNREPA